MVRSSLRIGMIPALGVIRWEIRTVEEFIVSRQKEANTKSPRPIQRQLQEQSLRSLIRILLHVISVGSRLPQWENELKLSCYNFGNQKINGNGRRHCGC